jgi:hypothetical protein
VNRRDFLKLVGASPAAAVLPALPSAAALAAAPVASAVLDDYEEGYFTPTITGMPYTMHEAHYIRIGNVVTVTGTVRMK